MRFLTFIVVWFFEVSWSPNKREFFWGDPTKDFWILKKCLLNVKMQRTSRKLKIFGKIFMVNLAISRAAPKEIVDNS